MDNGVDGPVVELRVHGVSGTPPEAVLDAPQVRQVAGDEWARVFRAIDDDGREVGAPGHVVEALHWGRYTSGSWTFALWLLLVPFGMVNVARFMLPESTAGRRALTVAAGALRALGVLLTCLVALGAGIVLVDLVATQAPSAISAGLGPRPARRRRPRRRRRRRRASSSWRGRRSTGTCRWTAATRTRPRRWPGRGPSPATRTCPSCGACISPRGSATVAVVGLLEAGGAWRPALSG